MLHSSYTVYTGVPVVTMSEKLPEAEAVCVCNGRIVCVGSQAEVTAFAGSGAEVIDLRARGGAALYPGFIDTHSHLTLYSAFLDQAYCGNSTGSVDGVIRVLRQKAQDSPEGWVLGYGYDDSGISDKRHLTRHDLDAVSTDRPVFVSHISSHMGYANTVALRLLNITAQTRVPCGEVVLGDDGQPNGLLLENAYFEVVVKLPTPTVEQTRVNIRKAIAEYNSCGFTTFQDGGIGINAPEEVLSAYFALHREKQLTARAYLQFIPPVMERLLPLGMWQFGSDHLVLGGLKYFVDGSIQGYTAALNEDYHDRPGFRSHLLFSPEEILETISRHHCLGIQVAVHTNGDAATEAVLQGFEQAFVRSARIDLRHMIIHAQLATEDHLRRMKKLGIIPSFFSRHIEHWGDRHKARFLGPERTARMNAAGTSVALGMPFGLHVDTPVQPVTALGSMHAAINRVSDGGELLGPDQRISSLEALKAYTSYAALSCGGEHDRGWIEPGRFADFTLLGERLEQAAPERVRHIPVCTTICGGRIVYQA